MENADLGKAVFVTTFDASNFVSSSSYCVLSCSALASAAGSSLEYCFPLLLLRHKIWEGRKRVKVMRLDTDTDIGRTEGERKTNADIQVQKLFQDVYCLQDVMKPDETNANT